MEERPMSLIIKEITNSLVGLFRSEIRLAKTELARQSKYVARDSIKVALFGAIAGLGVLCLLAFVIVGLGDLFNGRYWLSSLLVGLALVIPGAVFAIQSAKQVGKDAKLPISRQSLEEDKEIIDRKLHDLSDRIKQRAS